MANGKRFNMNRVSCAHKTLPLGTMVLLRNVYNNKVVIAEVTDRGPYIKHREFDLSRAAAKALDFTGHGLTIVRYQIVGVKGDAWK
jgi:rare lipoprotein A